MTVRDASISDFRCLWEASHLVRVGLDPYDRAVWSEVTRGSPGVPPCNETFIYPLWTAEALVPLTLVPERDALAVWEVILFASLLGGVWLAGRAFALGSATGWLLLLTLASQPAYSAVANAQLGPVLFFALAAVAYAAARRRYTAAAASWCLLLLKPHVVALALVTLPVLIRARRFLVWIAVAVVVVVGASLAANAAWPAELVREVFAQERTADAGLATFFGVSTASGLPTIVAVVATVAALVGCGIVLRGRTLATSDLVAVLAPASLLLTPYARPHDQVILALSWASVIAATLAMRGGARRLALASLVAAAFVLPWALFLLSLVGLSPSAAVLVPLATGALISWSVVRTRRAPRSRAAPAR